MQDTRPLLLASAFPAIERLAVDTLQLNLGYRCNQSCSHCHVNAGPTRTEMMELEQIELALEVMRRHGISTLDVTGGAPELNPHFRHLVRAARASGIAVIDRCNLTILLEPGQEDLAQFLAAQRVAVTASLPCYLETNVDSQRGQGVYTRSVEGLRRLNALGYGQGGELELNLVYNPLGAILPPPQQALEQDYKRELLARFGIVFDRLLTLTNLPISRFGAVLLAQNQFHDYLALLKHNFVAQNLDQVMCRRLLSVDWRGFVYDCDFNQMLDLPLLASDRRLHLRDLLEDLPVGAPITTGEHCFGCTAGQGSSCSGALAA
ncbi:MAG: arsenosugar biosynthesis radical SAM protein ArsS [Gammaproteobacteria bacterium]|nr:arsenosugar biosynthesis radical SAM protein ArsS [Gammaproteobacteria bacterium]